MKKVKCVIWILLCTLTVCACQSQEKQSPTDTVDAFMKALSSMDGETLDSLYAAEEPLESMLDSETWYPLCLPSFSGRSAHNP